MSPASPSHVPEGYHAVTPYLAVTDAARLIAFATQAFGAVEIHRVMAGSRIRHAQLKIGDSVIMLGEPQPPWHPMAASLYVYVADADATYARALAAGGSSMLAPADMDYGDRSGGVKDPSGNAWWIASHVEDVDPEELARRAAARGK
jgi:uncharacterized glyoxalase superfamily protein PhnB